jgi:hypothetical protein
MRMNFKMDSVRGFVVGLTLLSFTACTSLQPIRDFTPSRIREQVHAGDRVSILWRSGAQYDVTVTAVDADALHGTATDGKHYKILFEDIRSIEVEKTRGWQVGTVFGATLTVGLVAFLLALIKGWEPGGGESGSSGSSGSRD